MIHSAARARSAGPHLARRTFAAALLLAAALATSGRAQGPVIGKPERVPTRMPAGFVPAADTILTKAYPLGAPGAIALVAKDGRAVFRRAVGLADLEFSIMLEPDMVLKIGSVSKQFTAAAILLLAEQGKLALDDDVLRYVPDLQTGGRHVSIEHLLTHTSGVATDIDFPAAGGAWGSDVRPGRIMDLLRRTPLQFEPGTDWRYSNSGYVVLGEIIEKASGQPYAEFLHDRVLLPLGLGQTMYDDPSRVVPRRAHGYIRSGDEFLNAPPSGTTQTFSAGGLISTVDDLLRWDTALSTSRLLKAESVARMFASARLASGESTGYGYGWFVTTHEGHPVAEHGGGVPGFSCHVIRMPADRLYVAVLSNVSSRMAGRTARLLAALALGRPFRNPAEVPVPPPTLDTYAGMYRQGATKWTVTRAGSHLQLASDGEPIELVPSSSTDFFEPDGPLRVAFVADAERRITAMQLGGWGEVRRADRVRNEK